MPNAIAFFPWVAIDEPLTIGPVRLIPYERETLPRDVPHASQADIDGVLSAYALRKDVLVQDATLLELGDWHLGQDANAHVDDLFRTRELIAFAALAERRLFQGHFGYCNVDTYSLVIQNYQEGSPGTFSFFTRRRNFGTQHLWSADEFAFLKPLHVASNVKVKLDEPLMAAMLMADEAEQLPFDAISEFNRANTDAQGTPIHTEVVMTKSAFEYLFDIGHGVPEFVGALLPLVPERSPFSEDLTLAPSQAPPSPVPGEGSRTRAALDGPLAERWRQARQRPGKPMRPLEAWAREFCDLRGGAAHGKKRGGGRFVFSAEAHLAFASILFPLLVKQQLARLGFLQMNERDVIELEWIEDYLMHDPFDPAADPHQQPHEHPWSRTYSEGVLGEVLRRQIERQFAATDWSNLPEEPESQA